METFSKKFLSICLGLSFVLATGSLFIFSIGRASAEGGALVTIDKPGVMEQSTGEDYIPIGIHEGNAYWIVFNTSTGYKFRKSPLSGAHWLSKTE